MSSSSRPWHGPTRSDIYLRGNERKPIYRDEPDRRRFLERLSAVGGGFHLRVHAYVLMRNHYHLLV